MLVSAAHVRRADTSYSVTTTATSETHAPTRAAWLLADTMSKAGTAIDPDLYQKLLKRGFVHIEYTDDGKEVYYAVDSIVE